MKKTLPEKSLAMQTAAEFPKAIGARVVSFKAKSQTVATLQIELANCAREIGLLTMEWCGHHQMTLGFFESHRRDLPKEASFAMLTKCAAIARRMPGPAESIEDTRRLWQPTFESAGLLEAPTRDGQQQAKSVSRFAELVNRIGSVRQTLLEWTRNEPFDTWNADTRQSVKAQLQPLADFYATL